MKIYVKWLIYQPSSSVKIKFNIDKTVEYTVESLSKLLNTNLRRLYDISPTVKDNLDKVYLEGEDNDKIQF